MHNQAETPSPRHSARRKLIRGVFAAPAVLTVASGSAFAAASNLRCISQTTFPPVTTTAGADTFYRLQVKQIASKTYVLGSDIAKDIRDKVSVYMTTTQMHEFNVALNQTVGMPLAAASTPTPQTQASFAAIRFSPTGAVIGVGSAGAPGGAASGSCWNSFA